nr:hypothetical protein CFP56_16778 [Quercus suber]
MASLIALIFSLMETRREQCGSTPSTSRLERAWAKVRHPRMEYECMYCCEEKPVKQFCKLSLLPYECRRHLNGTAGRVCKTCLRASLGAQLDSKALLDIGCPQCSVTWPSGRIKLLVNGRDRKRYRSLDERARTRVYKLTGEMAPDELTTSDLLKRGARQCPWCQYIFIKLGGKCGKGFNIAYAPVLLDQTGRRAADIVDDSNADLCITVLLSWPSRHGMTVDILVRSFWGRFCNAKHDCSVKPVIVSYHIDERTACLSLKQLRKSCFPRMIGCWQLKTELLHGATMRVADLAMFLANDSCPTSVRTATSGAGSNAHHSIVRCGKEPAVDRAIITGEKVVVPKSPYMPGSRPVFAARRWCWMSFT